MTTDTTQHLLRPYSDLPLILAEAGDGWPVLVPHGGADEAGPEGRWTVTDGVVSAESLPEHTLGALGRGVSPWIARVFATADALDAEALIVPYSDDATTRAGNGLPGNLTTMFATRRPTDAGGKNGEAGLPRTCPLSWLRSGKSSALPTRPPLGRGRDARSGCMPSRDPNFAKRIGRRVTPHGRA